MPKLSSKHWASDARAKHWDAQGSVGNMEHEDCCDLVKECKSDQTRGDDMGIHFRLEMVGGKEYVAPEIVNGMLIYK